MRATNAGGNSSRRVSNCKIKKFRVGLVNPTYKTICNDEIAVPPQRGRLGGVRPVRLTVELDRRVRFNAPQPTTKEVFQC